LDARATAFGYEQANRKIAAMQRFTWGTPNQALNGRARNKDVRSITTDAALSEYGQHNCPGGSSAGFTMMARPPCRRWIASVRWRFVSGASDMDFRGHGSVEEKAAADSAAPHPREICRHRQTAHGGCPSGRGAAGQRRRPLPRSPIFGAEPHVNITASCSRRCGGRKKRKDVRADS